jgi:two-component system, OmpR family, response regulator VicR
MEESRGYVLLVDDDKDFAKVVRLYLEKSGMEVAVALSGKKALKAFDARKPDVMILDVNMPKMDGMEVCSAVRAKMGTQHLPIIALTAFHSPEKKKQMMEVGADVYLTKPMDLKKLVAQVEQLIGGSK